MAVGRSWVWGVPTPSADEPALAAMINGQVWDLGIACWRKEANGEAPEGGRSFLSASLPSSWPSWSEQLSLPTIVLHLAPVH